MRKQLVEELAEPVPVAVGWRELDVALESLKEDGPGVLERLGRLPLAVGVLAVKEVPTDQHSVVAQAKAFQV